MIQHVEPSSGMYEYTRSIVDVPVVQMKAGDMSFKKEFDAIWACALLLHVPKAQQKKCIDVDWGSVKTTRHLLLLMEIWG